MTIFKITGCFTMADENKRFIMPGDEIGTSEEYIAGEGTYEKNGMIIASNTGFLDIDMNEMVVRVIPATSTPVLLKVSDLVYGVIFDNKGAMSIVDVVKIIGSKRDISNGDTQGSIHISKVTTGFLKDLGEAFKIGDIIRAKVIQVDPSLQLATYDSNLGVVLANCIECQVPLERRNNELECPVCESRYRKKLADDYGAAKI